MDLQFISEIIGTVAFAISGAMLAIDRRMDIFGVLFLGIVTAMGGGFIRDLALGRVPPAAFTTSTYLLTGFLASLYTFFVVRWKRHILPGLSEERFQLVLNFTDAIGLGLFSVTGVNAAINYGYGSYHIFAIFCGLLTGVGGGMLRDIMAGLTPAVLKKHVYACASLAGAILYDRLLLVLPRDISIFAAAAVVVVIRMLAYHYKWNLPRAVDKEEKQ